jgi:hypothetical protein
MLNLVMSPAVRDVIGSMEMWIWDVHAIFTVYVSKTFGITLHLHRLPKNIRRV